MAIRKRASRATCFCYAIIMGAIFGATETISSLFVTSLEPFGQADLSARIRAFQHEN